MGVKADINIGQKYEMLTVLNRIGSRADSKGRKRIYWTCQCDCGKITEIPSIAITTKGTKSCGCLLFANTDRYTGIGDLRGTYWSSLKHGAKKRNISFKLEMQDAYDVLVKQNFKCALSGLDICLVRNPRLAKKNGISQTASLDRINPKIGYQLDNIQWLHVDVNFMKQDFNNKEMIEMCKRIVNQYGV